MIQKIVAGDTYTKWAFVVDQRRFVVVSPWIALEISLGSYDINEDCLKWGIEVLFHRNPDTWRDFVETWNGIDTHYTVRNPPFMRRSGFVFRPGFSTEHGKFPSRLWASLASDVS